MHTALNPRPLLGDRGAAAAAAAGGVGLLVSTGDPPDGKALTPVTETVYTLIRMQKGMLLEDKKTENKYK